MVKQQNSDFIEDKTRNICAVKSLKLFKPTEIHHVLFGLLVEKS